MIFTRSILISRHRLSHQQVDDYLQEHESKNFMPDKLKLMMQVREFQEVTDLFDSANLAYVCLKGPMLSYRLYKDASYRQFNDLDFLMNYEDVKEAIQILTKRGYKSIYYHWPNDKKRQLLVRKHTNQFFLHHSEKKISIELHWKLFKYKIGKGNAVDQMAAQNLNHIKYAGRNYSVFNNEFELLYLIIHGGLHAWRRLKWLIDVHAFLRTHPIDEHRFIELAHQLNADRMIGLCNEVLKRYFPGSEIIYSNEKRSHFLINYSVNQLKQTNDIEYNSVTSFIKYAFFKIKSFPGMNYKLSVIKRLMFSFEDLDNSRLPSNALFFYVYRPFGIMKRWI